MNFYKFLRKESKVQLVRNQNNNKPSNPRIPIAARTAIQGHTEGTHDRNLLTSTCIKRGGRGGEEGEEVERRRKGKGRAEDGRVTGHMKRQFQI